MKQKVRDILARKDRTVPVLSFPSAQLLGITVRELISDADNQAKGMKAICDRSEVGASLNMMDLSVEAEALVQRSQYRMTRTRPLPRVSSMISPRLRILKFRRSVRQEPAFISRVYAKQKRSSKTVRYSAALSVRILWQADYSI